MGFARHPETLEALVAFLGALRAIPQGEDTGLPPELWDVLVSLLADTASHADDLNQWEYSALVEGLEALREDAAGVAEQLAAVVGDLEAMPGPMVASLVKGVLSPWAPALHDVEAAGRELHLREGGDGERQR